jgi:cation transport regulator
MRSQPRAMIQIKSSKARMRLHSREKFGNESMPYRTNADLPPGVTRHLPPHAQDIYREAFNHAFLARASSPDREERAHRIAWAAVKRSYVKEGESWIARASVH